MLLGRFTEMGNTQLQHRSHQAGTVNVELRMAPRVRWPMLGM